MIAFCRLQKYVGVDSRGISELFDSLQCTDLIESHLDSIRLSHKNLTKYEEIRRRVLDIYRQLLLIMTICELARRNEPDLKPIYWRILNLPFLIEDSFFEIYNDNERFHIY